MRRGWPHPGLSKQRHPPHPPLPPHPQPRSALRGRSPRWAPGCGREASAYQTDRCQATSPAPLKTSSSSAVLASGHASGHAVPAVDGETDSGPNRARQAPGSSALRVSKGRQDSHCQGCSLGLSPALKQSVARSLSEQGGRPGTAGRGGPCLSSRRFQAAQRKEGARFPGGRTVPVSPNGWPQCPPPVARPCPPPFMFYCHHAYFTCHRCHLDIPGSAPSRVPHIRAPPTPPPRAPLCHCPACGPGVPGPGSGTRQGIRTALWGVGRVFPPNHRRSAPCPFSPSWEVAAGGGGQGKGRREEGRNQWARSHHLWAASPGRKEGRRARPRGWCRIPRPAPPRPEDPTGAGAPPAAPRARTGRRLRGQGATANSLAERRKSKTSGAGGATKETRRQPFGTRGEAAGETKDSEREPEPREPRPAPSAVRTAPGPSPCGRGGGLLSISL